MARGTGVEAEEKSELDGGGCSQGFVKPAVAAGTSGKVTGILKPWCSIPAEALLSTLMKMPS